MTDKRATRYFMSIAEACHLVLQATEMAKGGEIFVLDMGEAVSIYELACALIQEAGKIPEKDIQITEIGLRMGEKLNEELQATSQKLLPTVRERIFVEEPSPLPEAEIEEALALLANAVENGMDNDAIKKVLQSAVPTYQPK